MSKAKEVLSHLNEINEAAAVDMQGAAKAIKAELAGKYNRAVLYSDRDQPGVINVAFNIDMDDVPDSVVYGLENIGKKFNVKVWSSRAIYGDSLERM